MPEQVSARRLPIEVDLDGLIADLHGLGPDDWVPHFNTAYYEGDWSGAALRAVDGAADRLYPDPAAGDRFADTPILGRCPNVAALLATFRCPLLAVRFLRLGPGSHIREHRDYNLSVDDGEVRIHVAVTSNPGVRFHLDGAPIDLPLGQAWYLNLNLRHAVDNDGDTPRAHLVIDCVVDDWLAALVRPPGSP